MKTEKDNGKPGRTRGQRVWDGAVCVVLLIILGFIARELVKALGG